MADTKEQIQYDKDLAKLNATPKSSIGDAAWNQLKKAFDAKYPNGKPGATPTPTPAPELTQEEKDAAAAKEAEAAAAAKAEEDKARDARAAADLAAKGVTYKFKYPRILTGAEVEALSPEERAIYETEVSYKNNTLYRDNPEKLNADNAIRDRAKAEGRNLTEEEFRKLNVQTIQDRLFGLQGFKPGTPQNPFMTGPAAEKRPNNEDAMTFKFYQDYLGGHNNRDLTLFGGGKAEPMSLEEFTQVYNALGGNAGVIDRNQNRGIPGTYSEFSKGQGELAIRTRGRAVPGMDLMLDPRVSTTADDVINAYMSQNPDDPMNLFSDISSGAGYGTSGLTGGSGGGTTYGTGSATTNLDVMKSILRGMGFNKKIIDSSSTFLNRLLKEGIDYDNAVSIFLNSQDYTLKNGSKIKSPFYEEYGYLNEGLVNPKTAAELYNAVEGYKGIIDKYGASSKFLTPEALKGYVKNNVTVQDLDERANMGRLKGLNADKAYVDSLVKLGFIGSAGDLIDFFMDFKIGKEQLELNRNTGAFTAEAIRRAQSGISFDKTSFEKLSAALTAKGLSESQISALAAQGFENIADTLNPLTMYSQIYEKTGGTIEGNQALQSGIQQELMGEQFLGTASAKRKKLTELGQRSFEGRSGFYASKSTTAGQI